MTTVLSVSKACPVCGSVKAGPVFLWKGESFIRCRACKSIYQDSPPSGPSSRGFYEENYYESLGERLPDIHGARLRLYERILSRHQIGGRTGGRILDVGCGYGDFLKLAQTRGWEVCGIEPSRRACDSARRDLGNGIFHGTTETAEFPENYFDAITLWNVIDCLPDPRAALRKIRRWLKPEGKVIIRTPNAGFHFRIHRIYSLFKPLLGRMGWQKEASVFLRTNLTKKSLDRLLRAEGFFDVRVENGPPTPGDPYRVFAASGLMSLAKASVHGFAGMVALLTGNRILAGSNLLCTAGKGTSAASGMDRAMMARVILKRMTLRALAVAGYALLLPLWAKLSGRSRFIRVLLYHNIEEGPAGDMSVSGREFEWQMDFLKKKYGILSAAEAVNYLKRGQLPEKAAAAVTFDDGYEGNYRLAYPVLRQRNIPAAVFILSGTSESGARQAAHLGDSGANDTALLDWAQAREMMNGGIVFGSHGCDHGRLGGLGAVELAREMSFSRELIESQTGERVRFFSYPYGTRLDFNESTKRAARNAGYEAAFSKIFGTNGKATDLFSIRRIGIEASDTRFTFRAKLNGALGLLSFFDLAWVRRCVRGINALFCKKTAPAAAGESPILLVSVDFPPHTDGVSTISRELAVRISRKGKEMLVICPADRGAAEFDADHSYRAFRLPGYEWGYLRILPILLTMPWLILSRKIRKVFVMNIAYSGFLAWIFSFVTRLEYVVFAYGYEFEKVRKNFLVRYLYVKIYSRARSVVCCSEEVKRRLAVFGVPARNIEALYPAVDLERYRPRPVPSRFLEEKGIAGKKVLLTVGRLVERKGQDRVLAALPKISREFPEAVYCIVGIGPHEQALRQEARDRGVESQTRFLGKLGSEDLILMYNACDVFLMPSREISGGGHIEGFGIVFLEANACAKPVIGGNSGGVLEAIRAGETGFIVNPESPDEIADRVLELFRDPAQARKMGEAGLRWAREEFDWNSYIERSYETLMGKKLK